MTQRLYYDNSELREFDSVIDEVTAPSDGQARPAVILRESAFYPTSGGQVHDTGWLTLEGAGRLRVTEVADAEDGRILHYIDAPAKLPVVGTAVHGSIDADRRREHMQQHSGQHVLSAAFVELFKIATLSFHMADDYCSIDLDTPTLTVEQVIAAEKRANEVVFENRSVLIQYVTRANAEKLGLRKPPASGRDELRIVEFENFDISACGGTHVSRSGQIGSILLRKTERVRQGTRVEFVCGDRAVRLARRDYGALSESAALFSTKLGEVPEQIRKSFEDARVLRRQKEDAVEEIAGLLAASDLASAREVNGRKVVVRVFTDRDAAFAKLYAQRVTRGGSAATALVGNLADPPGLVFAQTALGVESRADMGALLKQVLAEVGGRGGGSRDFAQGGVPVSAKDRVEELLRRAADRIPA